MTERIREFLRNCRDDGLAISRRNSARPLEQTVVAPGRAMVGSAAIIESESL